MIGSAKHELAKWLSEVLDPVLQKYSKHCVKNSFMFAELMQNLMQKTKLLSCVLLTLAVFSQMSL